jgi:hypothetical protein
MVIRHKLVKVMEDGMISREPSFYHTDLDIMHVDAPSSVMHR